MNNNWILVEDEMPESGVMVLITNGRFVDCAAYSERYKCWFGINYSRYGEEIEFELDEVTHWQPLPAPPK